jgi:hypothetical protein
MTVTPQAPLLLVALVVCVSAHAGEQAVYKCKQNNGSVVFSPQPCGKNAQPMKVEVTPRAAPAATNEAVAPPAKPNVSENAAIRDISDGVADTNCRDDANRLYVEPDTSAIAKAEADIRELQSHRWVAANNPAQAQQMASDDGTRIIGLRNVIATERARADAQRAESRKRVDEALKRCDDQKRAREGARKITNERP